jgi:hypothetical protein
MHPIASLKPNIATDSSERNTGQRLNSSAQKVNFTGSYTTDREALREIKKHSSTFMNFLQGMGHKVSESITIMVTGIGTAFIAPLFIAFNPFSKEEEDTKKYSALREPVSAVIAVATQLGVVTKFNGWLDKLASTGKLKDIDLTASPTDSYLRNQIKKEGLYLSPTEMDTEIDNRKKYAFRPIVDKKRQELKNTNIAWEDLISPKDSTDPEDIMTKAEEYVNKKIKEGKIKISSKVEKEAKIFKVAKRITMKKLIAEAKRKRANTAIHGENPLQSVKIKKLVKVSIEKAEIRLKKLKTYGGIALTLITLPFTCGALNWLYPRMVEIIAPDLAKSKKKAVEKGAINPDNITPAKSLQQKSKEVQR